MDRFWSKVDKSEGCWLWTAHRNQKGYGIFWFSKPKRGVSAHRFAYELASGPIPDGLQLDHLCRNPTCVRPDHLEPVTALENTRRGRKGVLYTACAQGHAMTSSNTLVHNTKRGVSRKCRQCQALANRAYRARLAGA